MCHYIYTISFWTSLLTHAMHGRTVRNISYSIQQSYFFKKQESTMWKYYWLLWLKYATQQIIYSDYLSRVSNPWPVGHMQPRMSVNVAQHKIINLLKTWWDFVCVWLRVTMYLICGPRQFFFQCGAEMPKIWTPWHP